MVKRLKAAWEAGNILSYPQFFLNRILGMKGKTGCTSEACLGGLGLQRARLAPQTRAR